MPMTDAIAREVADLLNEQNQLAVRYTAAKILEHDRYIIRQDETGHVTGVAEVKKVQWYQCEIDHVSVRADVKRRGLGTELVAAAEERARGLGARVVQCTIRVGNAASDGLFRKLGYVATVTFNNAETGNDVTVYQKVL